MSEVKKYNAYAEGLTVHFELDPEGAWVAADDFDAQRLRADTAEAELEVLRQQHAEQSCIFCNNSGALLSKAKAAEQRIADLLALLAESLPSLDLAAGAFKSAKPARNKVRAALNPNPEAESHDRLDDEALQRRHDDERREYFRDGE